MAAPPKGKQNTRSGKAGPPARTKSGTTRKPSTAGPGPGPKADGRGTVKASDRARHHSPAGSKSQSNRSGPKSRPASRVSKKKKAGKTSTGTSGIRNWLLGLTLGLVVGCLGAFFTFHWPQIKAVASYPAQSPPTASSGPPPEIAATAANKMIFEEQNVIDPLVKKLELLLYVTLQRLGVNEKDMDFLLVTRKQRGEEVWDHVLMRVNLPQKTDPDGIADGVKRALAEASFDSKPKMTSSPYRKGLSIDVYLEKMHTHTIRLLPAPQTASLSRQSESSSAPPPTPRICGPDKPKVAIVIDDFGLSRDSANCFLDLEMPITISVLPFLEHSADVAGSAHRKGFEVMLHLPMQPKKWPNIDPGPGVLLTSMDHNEIKAKVKEAIDAVPYVVAVNNHMGSEFTEDGDRIGWALEEIGRHGLAFLDSVTSNRSQAYTEARRLNLTTGYRSIFLDNVQDAQAIRLQLKKLVAQARQKGSAVGIGHAHPVTCQVLRNEYNQLKSKVDLVSFTRIHQN